MGRCPRDLTHWLISTQVVITGRVEGFANKAAVCEYLISERGVASTSDTMTSRTTLVIQGTLPAKHQLSAKLIAARRRCIKVLQASQLDVLVSKKSRKRKPPSTSRSAARRSKK